MADALQLDIVSPERSVYSAAASLVEVPGSEGDFGVMPGHMPLISTLRPGVVTIHAEAGFMRFFVESGYAEVTNEACTILSAHVRDLNALTKAEAEEELAQAKRVRDHAEDTHAREKAEKQVEIAQRLVDAF
jgi:F-type H+-transporting ATPase subunit epsilon